MCGIFGVVSSGEISSRDLDVIVKHSQQRGRDSSGLVIHNGASYEVYRADYDIEKLQKKVPLNNSSVVLGHSRLITNGHSDNQSVLKD